MNLKFEKNEEVYNIIHVFAYKCLYTKRGVKKSCIKVYDLHLKYILLNGKLHLDFFPMKSKNNDHYVCAHPHPHTSKRDLLCQSSHCAWRWRHDRLTGCHVWRAECLHCWHWCGSPCAHTSPPSAALPSASPSPKPPPNTLLPRRCTICWTWLPSRLLKCQDVSSVQLDVAV